jgi:phage terminase large subunit-like protein
MWGMARKNGKSGIVAPVALEGLTLSGDGAEVYSAAADRPQAKLVFTAAKKTVELIPELNARIKIYRDVLEDKVTGSIYKALSADAYTKEGLSPTLVIADELHAWPNRELYDVLALGMGGRVDPMMLIVTTAGVLVDTRGQQSIAHSLFEYGLKVASGEVVDPTFYLAWWSADDGCDIMDKRAWDDANPGLGDILDAEELASAAARAKSGGFKESEFRIKRLNQWVTSSNVALPGGMFEALVMGHDHDDDLEPRVLFFDGSFNHDCTALLECFYDGCEQVVDCWEKPDDNDAGWRVPMGEVENRVFTHCGEKNVVEVAADPFRWAKELEDWSNAGLPVLEYPTSAPSRMVPAWAKFYDAVTGGLIHHDGDPRLLRHARNTTLKTDRLGPRPVKEHRSSGRAIDLLICAVGAYDRATWHASQEVVSEPLIAWGE